MRKVRSALAVASTAALRRRPRPTRYIRSDSLRGGSGPQGGQRLVTTTSATPMTPAGGATAMSPKPLATLAGGAAAMLPKPLAGGVAAAAACGTYTRVQSCRVVKHTTTVFNKRGFPSVRSRARQPMHWCSAPRVVSFERPLSGRSTASPAKRQVFVRPWQSPADPLAGPRTIFRKTGY